MINLSSDDINLRIAGVDEVGRGPLCGPVIAAAVILPPDYNLPGLTDSKKMSEKKRNTLFDEIKDQAIAWALGRAEAEEIDRINILQASLLAMKRAVMQLSPAPSKIYIDGNRCPVLPYPAEAIIKGDLLIPAISAASVLAKVTRDREMEMLDKLYPGYGLAGHKGYPTRAHLAAIREKGVSRIYRYSFKPVKALSETT